MQRARSFLMPAVAVLAVVSGARSQDAVCFGPEWTVVNGRDNVGVTDMAVDGAGNIYCTGDGFDTGVLRMKARTFKLDPTGDEQWTVLHDPDTAVTDDAIAICADAAGNSYVPVDVLPTSPVSGLCVVKYDTNGAEQWQESYDTARRNRPVGMTMDGGGNVYAACHSTTAGQDDLWEIVKFTAAGVVDWVCTFDPQSDETNLADDVGLDGAGNVYTAGHVGRDTVTLVRCDPTGTQTRATSYATAGAERLEVTALAVNTGGAAFVAARSRANPDDADSGYAVVAFDAAGDDIWDRLFPDAVRPNMHVTNFGPKAVTADDAGRVYVTGNLWGGASGYDCVTVMYDAAGGEQWSARFNGPTNGADVGFEIVPDDAGNTYVVGADTGGPFALRYGPAGAQQWADGFGDFANPFQDDVAAAKAPDGSLVVAAINNTKKRNAHALVRKYEPDAVPVGGKGKVGKRRVHFKGVPIGETRDKTVKIRNRSRTECLAVTVDAPVGPFTGGGEFTVPPRTKLKVTLLFVPTELGRADGSVTVHTSDPKRPQTTVPLRGKGKPGQAVEKAEKVEEDDDA